MYHTPVMEPIDIIKGTNTTLIDGNMMDNITKNTIIQDTLYTVWCIMNF